MGHLPDLERVFFLHEQATNDHADDSCCLSLQRDFLAGDEARWAEVRDQHLAAFGLLAEEAGAIARESSGWYIARPLVFAAHHVAELALKTATLSRRGDWSLGAAGHALASLLDLDREVNGPRQASRIWEDQLVHMLDQAWEAGRYPDRRSGEPLFDEWCCVSASALHRAIDVFTSLVDRPGSLAGIW